MDQIHADSAMAVGFMIVSRPFLDTTNTFYGNMSQGKRLEVCAGMGVQLNLRIV